MSRAEVIKAVQKEARTGDRDQIFETYRSQFPNPAVLARIIASTARDEDRQKYGALNMTLVVLLGLCGLLKMLTVWMAAAQLGVVAAFILTLIGLGISFAFAYTIYTYNGQMYNLIALLAGFTLLRTLPQLADDPIDAIVVIALMGAVMTLCLICRQKLFPGLKFFGVKTDSTGQYVLG